MNLTPMHTSRANHRRRAFTLIELLVVIGIVIALAGLLLPMILKTMRQGSRTRTQADLNTISVALEAYKADFGDYPRPPVDPVTGQPVKDTGAATLGKALIGPYGDGKLSDGTTTDPDDPPNNITGDLLPGKVMFDGTRYWVVVRTTTVTTPATPDWAVFDPRDGFDGPGFIPRATGGRQAGPYLRPEQFKMVGLDLCDREGNPILYFPATPGHPNINVANGFVAQRGSAVNVVPLYDANANITIFQRPGDTDAEALSRIRTVLGDYDGMNLTNGGRIDSAWGTPEVAGTTSGFLLWTAGPDGQFGPKDIKTTVGTLDDWKFNRTVAEKCDDVTNFK